MWILGRTGASGFSSRSTAEEVARGIDASRLTAIVTGASSGIGTETARVLASCGVHVIMAVRNVDKCKTVKETIIKGIRPDAKIDVMELDLASFASIRKFASEYKSLDLPLNLLINNAGVAAASFKLSQGDIEVQFATNHLGHFLLTNLLLDNMKKTARDSQIEGRILNVSSNLHHYPTHEVIRLDNINDSSSYSWMSTYGWSKLANILHANELSRRLLEEGVEITVNSLHPGAILHTNLGGGNGFVVDVVMWMCGCFTKSVPQGAATTCYVALHPQLKGVTGKYFADCNISTPSSLASDAELAKKLWDFSLNLTQES